MNSFIRKYSTKLLQLLPNFHFNFIKAFLRKKFHKIKLLNFFLFSVWLTKWSTDYRAMSDDDFRWRNIYIGVYSGLGLGQGKVINIFSCSNKQKFMNFTRKRQKSFNIAGNVDAVCDWMSSGRP